MHIFVISWTASSPNKVMGIKSLEINTNEDLGIIDFVTVDSTKSVWIGFEKREWKLEERRIG